LVVSDFVAQSYLKATGKVSSLTSTDSDWVKLLALGNLYQQTWAKETGVDWRSLYDPAVNCGTVSATDTFDLDSSIYKVSQTEGDTVRVIYASDTTKNSDFSVVRADRLKYYTSGNYCAQVGQTLKFNRTFKSTDPEFGGTIYVPGYTLPDSLVSSGDDIVVDVPEWLTTICAAEYARTNLVLQNQYPNILAEANELMKKMVENNNAQVETVPLYRVARGRTW